MGVPRFWREIPVRYRLIGSRCRICKTPYFPPRKVCPKCKEAFYEGQPVMEEFKFSGRGKVASYTTVRVGAPDFADQTPYVMAIVQLEEGPKITGQVVDLNGEKLDELEVEACFRRIGADGDDGAIYYGYKFRPKR